MQRIARLALSPENQQAINLFNQFKDIQQYLARHLPPSTVQIFAQPVIKENIVEWYSELQGQPIKVSQDKLDSALQQKIQNKLNSIQDLLTDLKQKNTISSDKAEIIEQLLLSANYSQKEIYVVNNEPVIVGWGMGKAPEKPVEPQPVSTAPPIVKTKKHPWCWWLLAFLLILLLASILWWFFHKQNVANLTDNTQLKTVNVSETTPINNKPIETHLTKAGEVKEENKAVEPIAEPKVETPVEPAVEPKVEPQIEEPIKQAEPVAPLETEQPKIEESQITQPTPEPEKVCRVESKPEELPQMVIVFDNSLSMLFSLTLTPQEVAYLTSRPYLSPEDQQNLFRMPNRLNSAKSAASSMIKNIAKNIPIGLVTLTQCPSAESHGYFAQNKRNALIKKINNIYPDKYSRIGGTPLYTGLQQASRMVDGKKREAFILLISDGVDTCSPGSNICALASQIAKQKPKLKINVIDIGGAQAANCVARATGGKVFTANNAREVNQMINQAIKPMKYEEICQ